jgi:hypothetical protein
MSRLEPAEAARIYGQAAQALTNASALQASETLSSRKGMMGMMGGAMMGMMERAVDPDVTLSLALVSVVTKLDTPQAATILLNGLDQTKVLRAHDVLADGLMTIADRMDQPEAARIRRRAIEIIVADPTVNIWTTMTPKEKRIVQVVERMQPADAAQI